MTDNDATVLNKATLAFEINININSIRQIFCQAEQVNDLAVLALTLGYISINDSGPTKAPNVRKAANIILISKNAINLTNIDISARLAAKPLKVSTLNG